MKTERLREPAQEVCDRLMKLCGITQATDEYVAALAQ
jgi:hypothetical protein